MGLRNLQPGKRMQRSAFLASMPYLLSNGAHYGGDCNSSLGIGSAGGLVRDHTELWMSRHWRKTSVLSKLRWMPKEVIVSLDDENPNTHMGRAIINDCRKIMRDVMWSHHTWR